MGSVGISIKGNVAEDQENAELTKEQPAIISNDKVSQKDLEKVWDEMKDTVALEEVHLAQTLQSHLPTLNQDGATISLTVRNNIQEKRISEGQQEILSYLRKKLNNDALKLSIIVDETSEEKKFFTSTEKLQIMVKKNPDLNTLRKLFDLDLE